MIVEDRYYEYAITQMERAKREKKKHNGYKDKADRVCFYTGTPYAERHEVFCGNPDRKNCIRLGMQVDLCMDKHRELQANITPWAKEENAKWRACYQRTYMDFAEGEGLTEAEALRAWMGLIGRNYIMELMPE